MNMEKFHNGLVMEKMEDGHDEESEKGEKQETGLRFLFYSYRTSCGDCGHRDSGGNAAAGASKGQDQGTVNFMPQ